MALRLGLNIFEGRIFMKNIGLVLEGGAMRGIYTAAVLDFFMEKGLYFPYVIGVSAGACQGFSYISKQKGRNKKVNINFIDDPQYLSYKNLFENGGVFGFDYMFNEIAREKVPFDFEGYERSNQEFVIGATNCISGRTEYFYRKNNDIEKMFKVCKASSSMPLVSEEVLIDGKIFLDGGISDSIPIKKSIADGNIRNVVILTRDINYRKKKSKLGVFLSYLRYKGFRGLTKALGERYKVYNETLDFINQQEKNGNVFVIRPKTKVLVKRMERDKKKLSKLYNQGYNDAKEAYEDLLKWIEK